jgi:hypothetical protein
MKKVRIRENEINNIKVIKAISESKWIVPIRIGDFKLVDIFLNSVFNSPIMYFDPKYKKCFARFKTSELQIVFAGWHILLFNDDFKICMASTDDVSINELKPSIKCEMLTYQFMWNLSELMNAGSFLYGKFDMQYSENLNNCFHNKVIIEFEKLMCHKLTSTDKENLIENRIIKDVFEIEKPFLKRSPINGEYKLIYKKNPDTFDEFR